MVKHILDTRAVDPNLDIRMMTKAMKEKFDKYWGESNLIMSIGAVLDPRFRMKLPFFCFPTLYPKEGESAENLTYLSNILNELYQEYVNADKANKKKEVGESSQLSSTDFDFIKDSSETPQGCQGLKTLKVKDVCLGAAVPVLFRHYSLVIPGPWMWDGYLSIITLISSNLGSNLGC
ncbi:hypothetical protein POM88_031585 [Heracleum sosnowskyi]|uniref:hAT-like transposase RNase-H fold domain-containing protein n=1 Tax=Heracleum sosnowskyi TaxID=360622 RepID=A0AAD8MJT1_9APIA|nr:hypothetical protein POM88_031585 [Heracleum sosnowskyi]